MEGSACRENLPDNIASCFGPGLKRAESRIGQEVEEAHVD